MCEANAYLVRNGKEELILEAVDIVEPAEGGEDPDGEHLRRAEVDCRQTQEHVTRQSQDRPGVKAFGPLTRGPKAFRLSFLMAS